VQTTLLLTGGWSGSPQTHAQPTTRAGFPATTACAGTSRVTTAPAPTIAYGPIVTGATSTHPAPSVAPRPTRVSSQSGARTNAARGRFTFVKTTAGPTKTSSSSVTPAQTLVWHWMRHRGPTTAPPAMKQNAPTTDPAPRTAPSATTEEG
jgi:hypothetical protein